MELFNKFRLTIKRFEQSNKAKLWLAGFLLVGGLISAVSVMITISLNEKSGMQTSRDFLMSETTHNPEMFIGYDETLAVVLPHPFVYRYHKFTRRDHQFSCEDRLSDLTPDEHKAMLKFYKACEAALDMVNAPADAEKVEAARWEIKRLVYPPNEVLQRMDGTGVCKVVNGLPFPGTGQPISHFMKNKALCAAYIESLSGEAPVEEEESSYIPTPDY